MRVKATEAEVMDGTLGGCVRCGSIQDGCEPDAQGYECDSCGEPSVYGLEELVMMDMLDLVDDDTDSSTDEPLENPGKSFC
jgi:hypothetical protein